MIVMICHHVVLSDSCLERFCKKYAVTTFVYAMYMRTRMLESWWAELVVQAAKPSQAKPSQASKQAK